MSRRLHRAVVVDKRMGDGGDVVSLKLAWSRRGRVVGEVLADPDESDPDSGIDKTAAALICSGFRCHVVAGIDDVGRLVDPVWIEDPERDVEKVASAIADPLTVAVTDWKSSRNKSKHLPQVILELRKVVAGRASDFGSRGGTEVPQAEFMRAGMKALKKYDPNKGARASTFVVSSLREAHRPLIRRASMLRVPEERLQQVGKIRRAASELTEDLGRTPTAAEIAKKTKLSKKSVELVNKETPPIHMGSIEEVPHGKVSGPVREVWDLLGPELKGTELRVYRLLRQRPRVTNKEIARRFGIHETQASRYRNRLLRRVEENIRDAR